MMTYTDFCKSLKVTKEASGAYLIRYAGEEFSIIRDGFWFIGYYGFNEDVMSTVMGWNTYETKKETVHSAKAIIYELLYSKS